MIPLVVSHVWLIQIVTGPWSLYQDRAAGFGRQRGGALVVLPGSGRRAWKGTQGPFLANQPRRPAVCFWFSAKKDGDRPGPAPKHSFALPGNLDTIYCCRLSALRERLIACMVRAERRESDFRHPWAGEPALLGSFCPSGRKTIALLSRETSCM